MPWPPEDLLRSPVFEGMALALGLIVGSFANVCVYRLGLDPPESVVSPPSRCPRCGERIRPWDNVPVLSYLWLRGRCRHCRAPISLRYPAVEAANGLGWLALAATLGPTPRTAVLMAFFSSLVVLGLIDLDVHLLPDVITLPGVAVGVLAALLPGAPHGPLHAVAAALGGYVALAAVAFLARRWYGQEALGQGDWKLVAMLGAFLGWPQALVAVLVGCILGAGVGLGLILLRRASGRSELPLGTFLALGGIAAIFDGGALVAWYRALMICPFLGCA